MQIAEGIVESYFMIGAKYFVNKKIKFNFIIIYHGNCYQWCEDYFIEI